MPGKIGNKNALGHRHSKETREKMSRDRKGTIPWNKGIAGKKHTQEWKDRMSKKWRDPVWRAKRLDKLLKSNVRPRYVNGFYDSKKAGRIFFRSSYELRMYNVLDADNDVKFYEVEAYEIEYVRDGKIHHYVPDIYVEHKDGSHRHIEIKPIRFVGNPNIVAKLDAAFALLGNQFVIVTEQDLVALEHKFS